MIELAIHPQGVVVPVHAQPGARREGILGVHDGALRIAVTAAPEKGHANAAIAALLALSLGCKQSRICLLSGETSRRKRFLVEGLTPDELRPLLRTLLPEDSPK